MEDQIVGCGKKVEVEDECSVGQEELSFFLFSSKSPLLLLCVFTYLQVKIIFFVCCFFLFNFSFLFIYFYSLLMST